MTNLTDVTETEHRYLGQFTPPAVNWALNLPHEDIIINRDPWGGFCAKRLWLAEFVATQIDDGLFDVWILLVHRTREWYGRPVNFRRLPIGVCVDGVLFK